MARRTLLRLAALASLAAVTAWAYAGSIGGAYVSDDVTLIAQNPNLAPFTLANVRAIFTSYSAAVYMPVTMFSFALDQLLLGAGPSGHHAVNVLLHVVNVLLLSSLLTRLGLSFAAAFVVSALFALHPVQVESVAWIIERKNVLSTFFFLSAFRTYLAFSDRPTLARVLVIVALYVAAVLSKINTAVLPAMLLVHDWVFHGRIGRRCLGLAGLLLLVGLAVLEAHVSGHAAYYAQYHGNSVAVTVRTSLTVIPRYFAIVFDPWERTPATIPLRSSWLDPTVMFSVAIVGALVAATIALLWRRRWESFWLAWFGILLSPMVQIIPLPYLMSDRYLYVPLVGLLVLPVEWIRRLASRLGLPHALLAAAATLAILTVTSSTIARVPVWHDADSLWADWALRAPGMAIDEPPGGPPRPDRRHRLEAALAAGTGAPAAVTNNLGVMAYEAARLDEAVDLLQRAHRLDPGDPIITLNLGRALLRSGRVDDARAALEQAVADAPLSFFAQLNLGRAALAGNDLPRARVALEQARALVPEPRSTAREFAELERRESAR